MRGRTVWEVLEKTSDRDRTRVGKARALGALMIRRFVFPFALASLALVAVGCGSDDGTSSRDDDITPSEMAEGDAWVAAGGATNDADGEPVDEPADDASITTPAEDSELFLDKDDALDAEWKLTPGFTPAVDTEIKETTKSCHRATGYRSGRAFKICITKVDGKWVEVNTARAYLRMKANARARGVGLYISSGFRTMAQQRYFYNCYKTKRCNNGNLAAPPGYSNHQSGHALDLNTSSRGVYSYLSSRGRAYGFRRTVPSEAWHWERW